MFICIKIVDFPPLVSILLTNKKTILIFIAGREGIASKKIPLRFWASLAGAAGVLICSLSDWVLVTNSKRAAMVIPGKGDSYNLFALVSKPESNAIRIVILIAAALLVLSIMTIITSIVISAMNGFSASKLQVSLTKWGFGLSMLLPLVFAVFAASISDPAILKLTLVPVIQSAVALAALLMAADDLRCAVRQNWQLYILLLPAIALVFIFVYLPMYGVQIAFRDFKAAFGIAGSQWVGLKHFRDFFSSYYAKRLLLNTFLLNLYGLLWTFPVPIILALFLNQLRWQRFKRFTQTVIYSPHFISPVVMVGIVFLLLSPTTGLINRLIEASGGTPIAFILESKWFRTIFISSEVWQHAGWNTILYIAVLTAIDPGLYEAAKIDGASKLQMMRHIDLPHMRNIIIMLFILNCGAMLSSNTDKALLMQTDPNIPVSDIIGLYVYRMGIKGGQWSYTAAINLMINVINFVLIISVNQIAKRTSDTSLM